MPTWGLILVSLGGPAVGAAIALVGIIMTNKHAAGQRAAERAFERERLEIAFRNEHRARMQEHRRQALTRMNELVHEAISARTALHGHSLVVKYSKEILSHYPHFVLYCSTETVDKFGDVSELARLLALNKDADSAERNKVDLDKAMSEFRASIKRDLETDADFAAKNLDYVSTSDYARKYFEGLYPRRGYRQAPRPKDR